MSIQVNSDDFQKYLLYNKYVSKITAETYVKDICENKDIAVKLPKESSELSGILECFYTKYNSVNVARRLISAFRHYNDFLQMKENKVPQKYVLTDSDMEKILEQPKDTTPKGIRDKAILVILSSTGICVAELIALNREDLDLKKRKLYLRGETKRFSERIIKLNNKDILTLYEYLLMFPSSNEKSPLFARVGTSERLSRAWIWKIVKKYSQMAGIEANIMPSDLRQYFACKLFEECHSIEKIQSVLGIDNYQDLDDYIANYYTKIKCS